MTSLQEFGERFFARHETDRGYLSAHYPRFQETKRRFFAGRLAGRGPLDVLDVGAHWLHQSLLWRADGHRVTAADVPDTLALPNVKAVAAENDITLIPYERMDTGHALDAVPDDSIDVVLFAEILEHITFNPIAFWREVYRVLAPGGRIVVTTPNYYWARGRLWDLGRVVSRRGGGLTVEEILHTPTYGPHWKEYSLREVVTYFSMLSRDFMVARADYVPDPRGLPPGGGLQGLCARWIESSHRVFYWGLHVETELRQKQHGIEVVPHW